MGAAQEPDFHELEPSDQSDDGFYSDCAPEWENVDADDTAQVAPRVNVNSKSGRTEGPNIAGMQIDCIKLSPSPEECYLTTHFKGRVLQFNSPSPTQLAIKSGLPVVPNPTATFEGHQYFLVARKKLAREGRYRKLYDFRWLYVQAPSNQLLQQELEEIADFASLTDPRKTASRLEMLATAIKPDSIGQVQASSIEVIDEPVSTKGEAMLDGCGFISDRCMTELLGSKAKTAMAVQVRVLSPRLGVFKGMLMRKPHINTIQLTPSMRKVLPSVSASPQDDATILIKLVHPTSNNKVMGSCVHPDQMPRGKVSSRQWKPPSEVVKSLLKHLGVPADVLKGYEKKCQEQQVPQHANLVGLADPTGALPEGHVFITGLKLSEVFITRFPCVKPDDGRVLPVAVTRPEGMSDETWRWLSDLPFGGVVFSGMGDRPLAQICADGDLDGDFYWVGWNEEIIRHLKQNGCGQAAVKTEDFTSPSCVKNEGGDAGRERQADGRSTSTSASAEREEPLGIRRQARDQGRQWLQELQTFLTEDLMMNEDADIGKLYQAWMRAKDELGMGHPDALAYATAYTDSLERKKHGNEITLPAHLPDPRTRRSGNRQQSSVQPSTSSLQLFPEAGEDLSCYMLVLEKNLHKMNVAELKSVIDTNGLPVKRHLGGRLSRTRVDIINDILKEVNGQPWPHQKSPGAGHAQVNPTLRGTAASPTPAAALSVAPTAKPAAVTATASAAGPTAAASATPAVAPSAAPVATTAASTAAPCAVEMPWSDKQEEALRQNLEGMKLKEIRNFVAKMEISVRTDVGGADRRKKCDIVNDVLLVMRMQQISPSTISHVFDVLCQG